ncbi:MAG: hypothetical protein E7294_05770 [Lachnospiraceae bacterium]|nr:hypothetical protein [Lachnospiraceae bacterium]
MMNRWKKIKKSMTVVGLAAALVINTGLGSVMAEETGSRDKVWVEGTGENAIQNAIDSVADNGTVIIPAGRYYEAIKINKSVTLKGEGNAVLDGSLFDIDSSNKSLDMIKITGQNVTVENLEITGLKTKKFRGPCATGIRVDTGAAHVKITDCHIHDLGVEEYDAAKTIPLAKKEDAGDTYNCHGIIVKTMKSTAITDVTIEGCTLENLRLGQSEALVVNGNVNDFEISRNTIQNCDNIGIDVIGYEDGKSYRATNGEVHHNMVMNISCDPDYPKQGEGNLTYSGGCAGGIYVDGGTDVRIYRNFVSGCDIGIEVASEHSGKSTDVIQIHNNTLISNDVLGGISIGGSEVGTNGVAESCEINNNEVYNSGEESACLIVQYANAESNKIHHNVFIARKGNVAENENGFTENEVHDNLTYGDDLEGYESLDAEHAGKKYKLSNVDADINVRKIIYTAKNLPANTYGILPEEYEPVTPVVVDTQPVYKWADDGSRCHAECIKNGEKVSEDAKIASEVVSDSTTEEMGTTRYTATFTNKLFTAQTKEIKDIACKLKEEDPGTQQPGSGGAEDTNSKEKTVQTEDKTELQEKVFRDEQGNLYTLEKEEDGSRIAVYTKASDSKKSGVTVPAAITVGQTVYNVTRIAPAAFAGNKKIRTILVGSRIKEIGQNAFRGCTKLKKIVIGSEVTKIGANAFYGCRSLTKIIIPAKVEYIGNKAFKGCRNLTLIRFRTGLLKDKTVGAKAFNGVKTTTVVTVPSSKISKYTTLFRSKGLSKKVKIRKN